VFNFQKIKIYVIYDFMVCNVKIFGSILQTYFAYAIMPVGKKKQIVHAGRQTKTPEVALRGLLFLILVMGRLKPIG